MRMHSLMTLDGIQAVIAYDPDIISLRKAEKYEIRFFTQGLADAGERRHARVDKRPHAGIAEELFMRGSERRHFLADGLGAMLTTVNNEYRGTIMMITRDTRFSAVKAAVHWWLLSMVGWVVGAGILLALAEFTPLAAYSQEPVVGAAVAIAGLAWILWAAWYIGHRDGYTERVVPIPHDSLAAYYGERSMDVIGVVMVATFAGGAACCCDDDD